MRKDKLIALEKVFEAEYLNRLPFSSKAKIYKQLLDEGYLQLYERTLGGRFPVKLSGYKLTQAGHYTYCSSCTEDSK